MTREDAKQLLPIITAFVEGKEIQYEDPRSGKWLDLTMPNWVLGADCYRIKPEPKKVLMTVADLPEAMIWLKIKAGHVQLVVGYSSYGEIQTASWLKSPQGFLEEGTLWSTDRKTWHTFEKEVTE